MYAGSLVSTGKAGKNAIVSTRGDDPIRSNLDGRMAAVEAIRLESCIANMAGSSSRPFHH